MIGPQDTVVELDTKQFISLTKTTPMETLFVGVNFSQEGFRPFFAPRLAPARRGFVWPLWLPGQPGGWLQLLMVSWIHASMPYSEAMGMYGSVAGDDLERDLWTRRRRRRWSMKTIDVWSKRNWENVKFARSDDDYITNLWWFVTYLIDIISYKTWSSSSKSSNVLRVDHYSICNLASVDRNHLFRIYTSSCQIFV